MKKVLVLAVAVLSLYGANAQSAQAVSELLSKETATFQDFAYLVASEAGAEYAPSEAFAWCGRFGSFPADTVPDTPITVRSASHFLVSNYGLSGGIMWRLTKSPRYAWRELKQAGFWAAGTDPDDNLSGEALVRAMGRFFDTWPEAKIRDPGAADARRDKSSVLVAGLEARK